MKPLILAALLVVAGCTNPPATSTVVYDAKKSLLAADAIALAYLGQPPCVGAARVDCVDASIKAQIKVNQARAYAAVKLADAVGGSTVDAATAIAALLAIIPHK